MTRICDENVKNCQTKDTSKSKLKISYTSKPITAYGGFIIFAKLFEKLNLNNFFESNIPIVEKSNNCLGIYPKVLGYFLTVLIGGKRFDHLSYLGNRNVMAQMFGVKKLPANSSPIKKLFAKLKRWKDVEYISEEIWRKTFEIIFTNKISDWVDFDSTILERYGNQEGSVIGYNPKRKGRPSHHQLIAMMNYSQYVVNIINRPGNSHSANNIVGLYHQTIKRISTYVNVLGCKADSGFYRLKFLQTLENDQKCYIISVAFYYPIQRKLHSIDDWQKISDGLEVTEFYFKHETWDKERRYIAIRQEIKIRPNSSGKQLKLFPEITKYRYGALVTNIKDILPVEIWREYKPRASDENIIGALKDSFSLGGFSMKSFFATELAMLLRVFLYNIFVFFKENFVSKKEKTFTLRRLHPKYFLIPATLGSSGNYPILRISIPDKSIRVKFQNILSLMNRPSL